jgi:hypothetical protein
MAASRILNLAQNQALAYRRGRSEEGRGNFPGPNSESGLQHQGCPGGGIDRRVGTDKKQLQPIVRDDAFDHREIGRRFHFDDVSQIPVSTF